MQQQPKKATLPARRSAGRYTALIGAVGWSWALALLATREHSALDYQVISPLPPAWGFCALSLPLLAAIAVGGCMFGLGLAQAADKTDKPWPNPTRWLMASYAIPFLDLARLIGIGVHVTFFEPLFLALISGQTASQLGHLLPIQESIESRLSASVWKWLPWILSTAAGTWWFVQGKSAYDNYLLGFHDFGHFARRVVNTWEGRGFLMETPSLPSFWDHFNPGLALLAPLWGLWPDAKLFIVIQAICLAIPAPLVYTIARRQGASPFASAVWSSAYLLFPAVGQLNLNFSYGWHPLSLALPLMFAAIAALLHGRKLTAAACVLLSCSFNEAVIVIFGGLAFGMAVDSLASRYWDGKHSEIAKRETPMLSLARQLPWQAWIGLWLGGILAFILTYKFAGYAQFQSGRVLSNLRLTQDSTHMYRFACYGFALAIPIGVVSLARGWTLLLALAVPLTVILSWSYLHPTSIAFQYSTTMIPILFTATIAGSLRTTDPNLSKTPHARFMPTAMNAFAACTVASLLFGALPWSRPTIKMMVFNSYQTRDGRFYEDDSTPIAARRSIGSHGNDTLNDVVAMVGRPSASVLATSRVASHLLGVRRLEPVDEAINRWDDLKLEAGADCAPIEIFDWIVLDKLEVFQQNREQMRRIREEAIKAEYKIVLNENEIVVFARPN